MLRTFSILLLSLTSLMGIASSEVIDLRGSFGTVGIGNALWVLEDPTGARSAAEALEAEGYVRQTKDVPNLGISPSVFWVRFSIRHNDPEVGLHVEYQNPDIDEIDLYRITNGVPELLASSGLSRPRSESMEDPRGLAFQLGTGHSTEQHYLMRVRSLKQLLLPLVLRTSKHQQVYTSARNIAAGLYFGVMLVMALYNLFIFFSTKDRSYFTYVVYIVLVGITQVNFLGYAKAYWWPADTWWAVHASLLLTLLTAVAASEFMRGFINSRQTLPALDRMIPWFYGFFVICTIAYSTGHELIGYALAQAGVGLFATFLMICMILVWRKGSRQAGFFVVAWSAFLVGTVVFVLKDIGLLPYNEWTLYTMPIGSAVEGVLLSFALADRINILRKEKEDSQAESLRALQENERLVREQNALLEQKVKQRTHALQESNDTLKRTQARLVSAEKMASLGQLTAGIAHEINNPINFITSNIGPLRRNITEIVEVMQDYRSLPAEQLEASLTRIKQKEARLGLQDSIDELGDIINSIAEGSTRTAEIVRGLRNFSRLDEDDLKDADINEGITSTLAVLSPQYRDRVEFKLDLGTLPKVECYPGKVNQVLMNILTNAAQATLARMDGRTRMVTASSAVLGEQVEIVITDTGIGMNADVQERIFDPFFTTKPVGEGTGLGLSIVYGIIEDHHGQISVESAPGVGSSFRILLPLRQQRREQQRA